MWPPPPSSQLAPSAGPAAKAVNVFCGPWHPNLSLHSHSRVLGGGRGRWQRDSVLDAPRAEKKAQGMRIGVRQNSPAGCLLGSLLVDKRPFLFA
eukprot:354756-Chlamydomonas_euryale.AAC.4